MAETLFFNALRAAIDEEMARDSWFNCCFGDAIAKNIQYPKIATIECLSTWKSFASWILFDTRMECIRWNVSPGLQFEVQNQVAGTAAQGFQLVELDASFTRKGNIYQDITVTQGEIIWQKN